MQTHAKEKRDQSEPQLPNSRKVYSKMPFSKESGELTKSCEHEKMKNIIQQMLGF